MANINPAFNLGALFPPAAPVYAPNPAAPAAPVLASPYAQLPYQPAAPAQPMPAAIPVGYANAAQLANPVGVGAVAGWKAPRGIQAVRNKLNINMYGQTSLRGGSRGYSSYSSRGYSNSSRYNSRSYSNNRIGSNGVSAPFGVWAAVKSSVIWGGVISLAINGYKVFNNQETTATAGANVTGDIVSSGVGGAAGALASWAGGGMLATMGMGGVPLIIAGIGLGIAGFFVADQLLRATDIFKSLQSGVYSMLGGK